jgi:hypothetical protein
MQCPAIYDKVEEVMKKIPGIKVLPRIHTPSGSEDCALFIRRVIERGGQAFFRNLMKFASTANHFFNIFLIHRFLL